MAARLRSHVFRCGPQGLQDGSQQTCRGTLRRIVTVEKLIREILVQARNQPHGKDSGGWIVTRVPRVSERDLSLHIKEASHRGLLKAVDVTNHDSPHDEWKVLGITASGLQFLEETKRSRKARLFLWTAILALIGFLGWLIPVLISLSKR